MPPPTLERSREGTLPAGVCGGRLTPSTPPDMSNPVREIFVVEIGASGMWPLGV